MPRAPCRDQGGAVYLDGSDDYIEINKIADDMPASNNFSISVCVMTTTGDGNVLGSNDTGSGHDYIFGLASNGYVLVEADSVRNYPPALNDGTWHMITYVRDGTTATTLTAFRSARNPAAIRAGRHAGRSARNGTTGERWMPGRPWTTAAI
jgi:hypothetical protein